MVIVVLAPAVSDTPRAWLPRGEGATVAVVVTDVMPRREIRVMFWVTSEVRTTVAVRSSRSQVRLSTRIRLRPRTPLMVPLESWSGSAGSTSRMPGRL
nr:hypothetical protein [Streptomyces sp. Ag82_O1-15]